MQTNIVKSRVAVGRSLSGVQRPGKSSRGLVSPCKAVPRGSREGAQRPQTSRGITKVLSSDTVSCISMSDNPMAYWLRRGHSAWTALYDRSPTAAGH